MPEPNVKGLVVAAAITLPVGAALFIGGVVSIAVKHVALGGVLMAVAIVSLGIGCALALVMRSRLRAFNRHLQASQQTDLDPAFRNGRLP